MQATVSNNVTLTLTLTPAQVTQLLTAVHVRSIQADTLIASPRFSECTPEHQATLHAQAAVAAELQALVERALLS